MGDVEDAIHPEINIHHSNTMLVKHRHVFICILFLFRCHRHPSINGRVVRISYLLLLNFSTMYSRIPYWYGSNQDRLFVFTPGGKWRRCSLRLYLLSNKTERLLLWLAILLLTTPVHFLRWTRTTADWPGLAWSSYDDEITDRPIFRGQSRAFVDALYCVASFVVSSYVVCLGLRGTLFVSDVCLLLLCSDVIDMVFSTLICQCVLESVVQGLFSYLKRCGLGDLVLITWWWSWCWFSGMRRRKFWFKTVFERLGVSDMVWTVSLIDQLFRRFVMKTCTLHDVNKEIDRIEWHVHVSTQNSQE